MTQKRGRRRRIGWRKPDRKSVLVKVVLLTPDMHVWLREQSKEHSLSVSELIRQAITRVMKRPL